MSNTVVGINSAIYWYVKYSHDKIVKHTAQSALNIFIELVS